METGAAKKTKTQPWNFQVVQSLSPIPNILCLTMLDKTTKSNQIHVFCILLFFILDPFLPRVVLVLVAFPPDTRPNPVPASSPVRLSPSQYTPESSVVDLSEAERRRTVGRDLRCPGDSPIECIQKALVEEHSWYCICICNYMYT